MSLEMYPKTRKRAKTVSGDSLCHFAAKKVHLIERLQCWFQIHNLYFYSRNILPENHLCLKINQIISIQASCLIPLVLRTRQQNFMKIICNF
jgi:hypothetical protein